MPRVIGMCAVGNYRMNPHQIRYQVKIWVCLKEIRPFNPGVSFSRLHNWFTQWFCKECSAAQKRLGECSRSDITNNGLPNRERNIKHNDEMLHTKKKYQAVTCSSIGNLNKPHYFSQFLSSVVANRRGGGTSLLICDKHFSETSTELIMLILE